MKPKKEIVILAVVIVAAVAYLALRKTDRTHFDLPQLPSISTAEITKLETVRNGQRAIMEKRDGKWWIQPQGWPADADKIRGMLDIVAGLKLTALISESKSYTRYELDDAHRITVTAWKGDKAVLSFDVGKSAPTYQHTHVRLQGDPNVYHAREDFRGRFDRDVDQLRDLSILAFKAESIQRLAVTADGQIASVERKAGEPEKGDKEKAETAAKAGTEWIRAGGGTVDAESVQGLVNALSRLECMKFLDEGPKADATEPTTTLVLNGEKEYRLDIFAKNAEGDYPALSSGTPYPFVLSGYQVDEIKEKIDKILKPEAEKETGTGEEKAEAKPAA